MPYPSVIYNEPAKTEIKQPAKESTRNILRIYCYKNRITAKEFFDERRAAKQKEKNGQPKPAPVFETKLMGSHFYL